MADNFVTNAGSGGNTYGSDEISAVHYPRIKLIQGADGTNDGDVSKTNPLPVAAVGLGTNGLSVYRTLDADETEEEAVTGSGTVYGMWVTNVATSTRFVKLYDATAGAVTVGTTTPKITIGVPGNSSDDVSGVFNLGGLGVAFTNAVCVAATTGLADNDTGAPGTNDVIVNIFYKQ